MTILSSLKKLRTSKNIGARVLRGGFWVSSGNLSEQGMRLVRNMILTRILAPEAFGLIAIVLTVNSLFEAFTEVGIKEAIIQNPRGQERTYLNGAWWFSFTRGVILYSIFFFMAPWVADFYDDPQLINLFRVAFLSTIFIGAFSPKSTVAMKQLKYFKWAIFFNGGGILGILTALSLGYIYGNVWALIIGFAIENLSRLVLSYILFPFLPSFKFDKADVKALLGYASGMFGLPILTLIFMKSDIIVIGKICSVSDLGLYSMAASLAWLPFQFITMVSSRIMMPAFSEKQQDKEWINKWTYNITTLISFIGFPLLFLVIFYGETILATIYGMKYGSVAVPFAVIFAVALLRTCSVPIASVYLSSGNPQLHRLFTGIRAVLIMIMIVPMVRSYGLVGASLSALSAMLFSYFFQIWKMKSLTGLRISPYLLILIKGISISLSVLVLWYATKNINIINPILKITPGLIGCAISYAICAKGLIRMFAYGK